MYLEENEQVTETTIESKEIGSTFVTREQREELKSLSKALFGVTSKWQKFYKYNETVTTKVKQTVKGVDGAPDTEQDVQVPVQYPGTTGKYAVRKYRSTEEVLELLRNFKEKLEAFNAENKKRQEEQAKLSAEKAAAEKLQEAVGGSAL